MGRLRLVTYVCIYAWPNSFFLLIYSCAFEDRLLECEVEGDEAISNVPELSLENVFKKTSIDPQVHGE